MEEAFGGDAPLMMLGSVLGRNDGMIEDLVTRDVYLDAVKRSGHKVDLNDAERKATMNVRAMEMAFQRLGLGKFGMAEKAAAALVLLGDWGKDPSKVPATTKAGARALIDALNAHFAA